MDGIKGHNEVLRCAVHPPMTLIWPYRQADAMGPREGADFFRPATEKKA